MSKLSRFNARLLSNFYGITQNWVKYDRLIIGAGVDQLASEAKKAAKLFAKGHLPKDGIKKTVELSSGMYGINQFTKTGKKQIEKSMSSLGDQYRHAGLAITYKLDTGYYGGHFGRNAIIEAVFKPIEEDEKVKMGARTPIEIKARPQSTAEISHVENDARMLRATHFLGQAMKSAIDKTTAFYGMDDGIVNSFMASIGRPRQTEFEIKAHRSHLELEISFPSTKRKINCFVYADESLSPKRWLDLTYGKDFDEDGIMNTEALDKISLIINREMSDWYEGEMKITKNHLYAPSFGNVLNGLLADPVVIPEMILSQPIAWKPPTPAA